jgi:transposase-like protein
MTETKTTMDAVALMRKHLEAAGDDQLRQMVQFMAEALMDMEAEGLCNAPWGARSEERTNQRNGFRRRRWDTRVGSIDLAIPKLRRGSYFPEWLLEPRRRSEKALVAVVAESYVQGVSTRKVEAIVQQLGIDGISRSQVSELAKSLDEQVDAFRNRRLDAQAYPYLWLDAMCVKTREEGRIVNVAVVVATGVNANGGREVLGVDVVTVEDGAAWTSFLRGLVARGLRGVKLVVSDAHEGLQAAVGAALPGASWQRCRTHFMRNLLTRVAKSAQGLVASLVRSIFEQPNADAVWAQHSDVVTKLEERFPEAAKLLDQAAPEVLAFTSFPKEHWRRIWSNNPQERVNKELRRRSDVVGIFPNRASIIRLLGAVLAEQHDEWAIMRRYLTIGSLEDLVRKHTSSEEGTLAMTA